MPEEIPPGLTPFVFSDDDDRKVSAKQLEPFRVSGFGSQLVFVNGRFAPKLSSIGKLPGGVRVNGLADEIAAKPQAVESHLGRYLNIQRDAFSGFGPLDGSALSRGTGSNNDEIVSLHTQLTERLDHTRRPRS